MLTTILYLDSYIASICCITPTQTTLLTMSAAGAISSIFSLYDKWGMENYIGENVTQLQHAQQVQNTVHSLHYQSFKLCALVPQGIWC